jgi:hypothetical protein
LCDGLNLVSSVCVRFSVSNSRNAESSHTEDLNKSQICVRAYVSYCIVLYCIVLYCISFLYGRLGGSQPCCCAHSLCSLTVLSHCSLTVPLTPLLSLSLSHCLWHRHRALSRKQGCPPSLTPGTVFLWQYSSMTTTVFKRP